MCIYDINDALLWIPSGRGSDAPRPRATLSSLRASHLLHLHVARVGALESMSCTTDYCTTLRTEGLFGRSSALTTQISIRQVELRFTVPIDSRLQ